MEDSTNCSPCTVFSPLVDGGEVRNVPDMWTVVLDTTDWATHFKVLRSSVRCKYNNASSLWFVSLSFLSYLERRHNYFSTFQPNLKPISWPGFAIPRSEPLLGLIRTVRPTHFSEDYHSVVTFHTYHQAFASRKYYRYFGICIFYFALSLLASQHIFYHATRRRTRTPSK